MILEVFICPISLCDDGLVPTSIEKDMVLNVSIVHKKVGWANENNESV